MTATLSAGFVYMLCGSMMIMSGPPFGENVNVPSNIPELL
jgi:hypothetical protein